MKRTGVEREGRWIEEVEKDDCSLAGSGSRK